MKTKAKGLTFKEAYELMREGYKVKMPEWKKFWYWDNINETIVMQPYDLSKRDMDIREIQDVEITLECMFRNDWITDGLLSDMREEFC